MDIILTGSSNSGKVTKIYKNDGNLTGSDWFFSEITDMPLIAVDSSSVMWGDYDNDGDPDLLLTGNSDVGKITKIYENSIIIQLQVV